MKKHGYSFNEDKSYSFSVWAPLKNKVQLHFISPVDKFYNLEQDAEGYWHITIHDLQPGARYLYVLDGDERPDIASLSQPEGVHKASELLNIYQFEWADQAWEGLPLEQMIIYELHVGSFTNERTFKGVINRLDYLKDLGINTIEIMPVAQFPGEHNWGYDGVYPYAVQHSYGGANGLMELVNAAHQKEMAVILDVVYNHLGPEGNYFCEYGPYFTDKYKTPWGQAINYDDAYCDGVRDYFIGNARMWLQDFHIDGLRMDAVHAIVDCSAVHFLEELKMVKDEIEAKTGKEKVLIAEFDLNNPRYIAPADRGGYGLDGQWIDEFHHALHSLVTGEQNGYYEDFGELWHLHKAYEHGYVYTGEYSPTRKRRFGTLANYAQPGQFVTFAQNHDHIGNRMKGDRLTTQLDFEKIKLVAAAYLLSPFVPLIFMGEEYGEKKPFQYFVDHGDPQLIDMVREGRKKEFAYFQTEGEVPDPFSESTLQNSTLSWEVNGEPNATMLSLYKKLIGLRKEHPAFSGHLKNHTAVLPLQVGKMLIEFERKKGDNKVRVILNLGDENIDYQIDRPFVCIFHTAAKDWDGNGFEVKETSIQLPAFSSAVIDLK
ncbi:MAG: malto-oligosyltrehalose trehalohydrolase [Chitinophagaceae bacterium]|nr:malto-oligosyltrehalose trehalohydrolase [Chitinophagaceae bacterium]